MLLFRQLIYGSTCKKKNNSMSLNEAVNGQNLVFAHSLPHKLSIVNVIKQMLLCMKMYDQKTHNNENSHFQVWKLYLKNVNVLESLIKYSDHIASQ